MLQCQLVDSCIFLFLDLLDLLLALVLHLLAEVEHLVFEFQMNFVADALELLTQLGLLLVLLFGEGVDVLVLAHLLLLLADLEESQVLLELSLVEAVLIFDVLQVDLRLFLQLGELVEVLEHQVLAPLFVDLDLDLMFLVQVLELTLLVSKLSLLVLEFLLADEPEVVNSESFVVVLTGRLLFDLDHVFELPALVSEGPFVGLVIDIVNRLGLLSCLVLGRAASLLLWLGSHN